MTYEKFHQIDENPETNQHLAEIVESIETNGWQGLPLLAIDGQLFNGCHRATACEILDIEPEVHEAEITTGDDPEYAQYLIDNLLNAGDTWDVLRAIKALHEEGLIDNYSVEIMRAEYDNE